MIDAFYFIWSVLVGGIAAAAGFRAGVKFGRRQFRQGLEAEAFKNRCGQCGAMPRMQLIHVSGCETGWPDPAQLRLPGEF